PLTEDPAAWLHALVVPWLVIGAPIGAMALRMTRAAMGDVLEEDFMRTAAAKGLRERTIIRRHAVPAAAAPAVALVGANTALVVTNAILVEQVFDIPGVFRMSTQAMAKGDFPLLQGIVITGALLVVTASFVVDAIHAWLDPRIRA
ncbi:MAG TPA: ABC transporter permease, partial [Solirubrobacteraceae bacterium]|nr:ABC transporter permease [Solirubrobacteraceae bacterium]